MTEEPKPFSIDVDYLVTRKADETFIARCRLDWCLTEYHECDTLTNAVIWLMAAAKIHRGVSLDKTDIVFASERIVLEPWNPFPRTPEVDERWEAKI